MRYFLILFLSFLIFGCKEKTIKKEEQTKIEIKATITKDTVAKFSPVVKPKLKTLQDLADTTFVRLADYSHDFSYDLRYATTNNFLKAKVYNCAEKNSQSLIKSE